MCGQVPRAARYRGDGSEALGVIDHVVTMLARVRSGSREHERFRLPPGGLSDSARPPAAHQVRPEEPDDQRQEGKGKIAVDVLAMVEEVSVNHFVDDDDHDHDQQPNPPVGNEMLPHTDSIRSAKRFVKPSQQEEDSCLRQYSRMSPDRSHQCAGSRQCPLTSCRQSHSDNAGSARSTGWSSRRRYVPPGRRPDRGIRRTAARGSL
jgi:hypothetical protein